jgi:hypothetical protein
MIGSYIVFVFVSQLLSLADSVVSVITLSARPGEPVGIRIQP